MPPHCPTRGASTCCNSKQQKGGEAAVPGPGMALCGLLLGHDSSSPRYHYSGKCFTAYNSSPEEPREAVSWITVGKPGVGVKAND